MFHRIPAGSQFDQSNRFYTGICVQVLIAVKVVWSIVLRLGANLVGQFQVVLVFPVHVQARFVDNQAGKTEQVSSYYNRDTFNSLPVYTILCR